MMRRYPIFFLLLVFISTSSILPSGSVWGAEQTAAKEATQKIPSKKTSTKKTTVKTTKKKTTPQKKAATKTASTQPPRSTGITSPAATPVKTEAPPQIQQKQVPAKAVRKKTPRNSRPKKSVRQSGQRVQMIPKPATTNPPAPKGYIEERISAKSFIIMDDQTGATLYARAPDSPRQPASTIKIVTALIALKTLQNNSILSISNNAAGMPSSKVFLDPKRSYRANDLINAVLLASANDASVALAENIAGSEEKFANMMTMSAHMWGAENTIARTASGLTAEGQQSTARDLATLFRYAMQHDDFARRMREKKITTSYGKSLLNHNKALWRINGAVGGKTGYTVAARQTYVGKFTRDGASLIVAVMGCESMWADVAKLVDYGFARRQEQPGQ